MNRRIHIVALVTFSITVLEWSVSDVRSASRAGPKSQVELPGTIAGRCAAAYFKAFNSGDDEQMRCFETQYRTESALKKRPMEERLDAYHELRKEYDTLVPQRIALSLERQITMAVLASRKRELWGFRFELADEPPHELVFISMTGPAPPGRAAIITDGEILAAVNRAQPIDDEVAADTVKAAAEVLREQYVYPEKGNKMAKLLTRRQARGRYKGISSSGELADKLTDDVFAICQDRHLWFEAANPAHAQSMFPELSDPEEVARQNFGFRKVEVLPNNIGYIKFDMFRDTEEALATAAAALASVADCDALIFDLRDNHGGRPEMLQFICSYLFHEPTVLLRHYGRLGNVTLEMRTFEEIPGTRFDADLPVYVLTSSRTGSAAEAFTYTLKHHKRATVVGETTQGMAHPSEERVLNDYFSMLLPIDRAEHPITKSNWEGVGVVPNTQVPADKALDEARDDATKKISVRAKRSE